MANTDKRLDDLEQAITPPGYVDRVKVVEVWLTDPETGQSYLSMTLPVKGPDRVLNLSWGDDDTNPA